jgi:hypothetical protein
MAPAACGLAQLFVDEYYGGAYMILSETGGYGIASLVQPDAVGNDTVSSLKVAPGYVVTLYADRDFAGTSMTFTQDVYSLGGLFNNVTSSVQVQEVGTGIVSTTVDISEFIQPLG